jgi:hypothetical protein
MSSRLFYTEAYREIEVRTVELINSQKEFLSVLTASSPRTVGDAIQHILSDNFESILGDFCAEYSADFARRAMADLAFTDPDGLYYVVDVKTHRTDTRFNMPNLTSVERLSRFYQDDRNYFVILIVTYELSGSRVEASNVRFVPVEFLMWDCLNIGALGWGQIQIANSNNINIAPQYSRRTWMIELCDNVLDFYPREIGKINDRITHFQQVREFWLSKAYS